MTTFVRCIKCRRERVELPADGSPLEATPERRAEAAEYFRFALRRLTVDDNYVAYRWLRMRRSGALRALTRSGPLDHEMFAFHIRGSYGNGKGPGEGIDVWTLYYAGWHTCCCAWLSARDKNDYSEESL